MSEVSSNSNDGSNLNALFESTMAGLSASPPAPEPVAPPTAVTEPTPPPAKKAEEKAPAVVEHEEIEFEGKKYKVDKSPREIMLEMLNAKKGMRKAFTERDTVSKKIKEREADLARFDQITNALKTKGFEGLYESIVGKEGSFQEFAKKIEERAIKKYNATEDELRLIQSEERAEKERELREMAEKTTRDTLDRIQREKEEAAKEILSGRLTEAFSAVDFEGKLGDPEQETEFNEYVWDKARNKLKQYAEEKGIGHHEIPPKVIKSTFIEIASKLDKTVKSRIDADISKQVQSASDAATLAAQAKSTSNSGSSKATTVDDLYAESKGNWTAFVNKLLGG